MGKTGDALVAEPRNDPRFLGPVEHWVTRERERAEKEDILMLVEYIKTLTSTERSSWMFKGREEMLVNVKKLWVKSVLK